MNQLILEKSKREQKWMGLNQDEETWIEQITNVETHLKHCSLNIKLPQSYFKFVHQNVFPKHNYDCTPILCIKG